MIGRVFDTKANFIGRFGLNKLINFTVCGHKAEVLEPNPKNLSNTFDLQESNCLSLLRLHVSPGFTANNKKPTPLMQFST